MQSEPTQDNHSGQTPDFERRARIAELRHKLRTPLNAIIGYSEMLLEDAQQSGQQSICGDLRKIRSAGRKILRILNENFRLSETGSVSLEFEIKNVGEKLSHSLRTPLNAVIGYCEVLLKACETSEICLIENDLKRIHSASRQFFLCITDMANRSTSEPENIDDTLEIAAESAMIRDLANDFNRDSGLHPSAATDRGQRLLVVDDSSMTRDLMSRILERHGHDVMTADNGVEAVEKLNAQAFDLVLLDVLMPEMNGYQVLKQMKTDAKLRDIPVIMISALEELESVVQAVEWGADDYLFKPINPVLLTARIKNCLERKRLSDLEREQKLVCTETFGIYVDQGVRDAVMSGRIPLDGEIRDVSVLFADLRNFSSLAESLPPKAVVRLLNYYFKEMAPIIQKHKGSILQYVGDEIYAVFGAPLPLDDHPRLAVKAALNMRRHLRSLNGKLREKGLAALSHGIGIHSGQAVAANIGSSDRKSYNLVGDTVNLASRIQRLTRAYNTDIIVSAATKAGLRDDTEVDKLALTRVKGRRAPIEIFKLLS